jgi:hypothetical protein
MRLPKRGLACVSQRYEWPFETSFGHRFNITTNVATAATMTATPDQMARI